MEGSVILVLSTVFDETLKKRGQTKKWLAEEIGIAYNTLNSKFSRNSFDFEDIILISDVLDIKLKSLKKLYIDEDFTKDKFMRVSEKIFDKADKYNVVNLIDSFEKIEKEIPDKKKIDRVLDIISIFKIYNVSEKYYLDKLEYSFKIKFVEDNPRFKFVIDSCPPYNIKLSLLDYDNSTEIKSVQTKVGTLKEAETYYEEKTESLINYWHELN
jgi:lambda repressor-like predicted transcriptional regulator